VEASACRNPVSVSMMACIIQGDENAGRLSQHARMVGTAFSE